MRRDRAWIERHIPHQGAMCLLDEIIAWDDALVTCRTATHCRLDNPLRARGGLPAVCGIEYAAQAVALHGALVSGRPSTRGYLASVRGVTLEVERLDDQGATLTINARLLGADEGSMLYRFDLTSGARSLLSGRLAVVLDATRSGIG